MNEPKWVTHTLVFEANKHRIEVQVFKPRRPDMSVCGRVYRVAEHHAEHGWSYGATRTNYGLTLAAARRCADKHDTFKHPRDDDA